MNNLPQNVIDSLLRFFQTDRGSKLLQFLQNVKDGTASDAALQTPYYGDNFYEQIGQFIVDDLGLDKTNPDDPTNEIFAKRASKRLEKLAPNAGTYGPYDAAELGKRVSDAILASEMDVNSFLDSLTPKGTANETVPMVPSLEANTTLENPKISEPGSASRVAKILNRFADIRANTAEKNSRFTGSKTRIQYGFREGSQGTVLSQIDRAVGTMGVFGMFHDKKEPWGTGEIQKMIADLAGKLGVEATDEFDTGRFLANRKQVAEVFRDMLLAIRHVNRNPDILDQASRDNLAAMVLEMSRILHDYSTPRSRAIFQKMYKRVSRTDPKSGAKFGLTADAAEIAAQGVQMPADALPGEKARLQRVAAAQVGQVPQMSIGEEPSATRDLESELRGKGDNVFDLQRYVDQFGLFGGNDTAAINIQGLVKYNGPEVSTRIGPNGEKPIDVARVERNYSLGLRDFLDSPLGFLADDALDVKNFFYETKTGDLKLRQLEARGDFSTAIALRSNLKYRSRVAKDPAAATAEMQMIVDAVHRATRSAKGSLVHIVIPAEGITLKIPQTGVAIMQKRKAAWDKAMSDLAARMGDKDAAAYMKSAEGIARFGEEPKVITEVRIDGEPNTRVFTDSGAPAARFLVMPESVAAELVSVNPEIAPKVRRLGNTFGIEFRAAVSPQYIVLKNGSVVSARSAEEGVITHRKVYPFKVNRTQGGGVSIEQLDSRQFEVTDPSQISDRDTSKAALKKFSEIFSADGPGFNDPSAGPLLEQVVEIIRTDAYAGLEILAMNGDVFPQLESELISSILEVGDFRVDRAPEYFRARQGNIEGTSVGTKETVSTTGGATEVTTMGLGTMKGRILSPAEARRLPVAGIERTRAVIGDVKDIVFNPERFGVTTEATIGNDVENAQAIVRGLMLLKKMSMVAGVQIGYGGLRAPDLRFVTKGGANELIRRDPFWMLADKEIYDRAATATTAAAAAERAFGGDMPSLSTEGGRAAIQAMAEADDAAILAARAAVEVARGVLGPEWSIELDPQYQRNRFPENPDTTRRAADAGYYPYTRLMDTISAPVAETVRTPGGALNVMRQSGALSSKADKFFVDLLRSGIEIGPSATSPEGLTTKTEGTTKLFWDPEMGWMIEQGPQVAGGGEVARGKKKFMVSELTQQDQDALTVAMVNKLREFFATEKTFVVDPSKQTRVVGTEPTKFGEGPAPKPSALEATQGFPPVKFKTIEEVRKVVDPKEVLSLFDPVVETRIKDNIRTEVRKSGKVRTLAVPVKLDPGTIDMVARLADAVESSGKRGQMVPDGHIKIVKTDGSEEIVPIVDFLKRRKTSKSVFDDMDGIEIASDVEEDYSWSQYADDIQTDVTPTEQPMPVATRGAMQKTARRLAVRMAIELQRRGSTSAESVIESVLTEFKAEMPEVNDVKALNRFFTKFWDEMTDVTLGKNVYTKARMLVQAMGKNIWVEKGIALLNQGPEGTPALGVTTRPVNEDKSGRVSYGPEETIVVTKKGQRLINADVALPVLKEMRPIFMDADLKVARPFYEFFAKFFGVKTATVNGEVQIPRLSSGPATKIIDVSVRQISQGKVPEFNTDMVPDSSIRAVSMDQQGAAQAPALSATGRPKKTTAETGDVSFDDLGGGFYEGQLGGELDFPTGEGDPDLNYSVRQGKLMGLLQPDRLLPKMSPRVRSIDASIRTPVGGTVAGAALDFATLGIGGNLTPENALFTGALNATQLLSKSPLKSTAIGAAASLGATAITGGDIGRTLFNLVGSMGGGIIGGVASGGLGSLGGSVAGGFVADELWKSLFNQDAGWQVRKSVPAPELKVRVP